MDKLRILTFLLLLFLVACAAKERVLGRANPTFLEGSEVGHKVENLPFEQAWIKSGFDGRKYTKIYIKPIRTDFLNQWEKSRSTIISSKEDYDKEAKEMADYFLSKLVKDINEYKGNRFTVSNNTGSNVLTIEIALTELEFSHPIVRAITLAVPIPGTGAVVSSVSDVHVAFALRITNPSGELVATVADRKYPPMRLIDFNKLTVTSSVREILSNWSKIMAEALNKGQFQKTDGNGRFSILPW